MKSVKKLLNALSVLLLGTSTSLNAQTPPQKPQPAPQTTQRPPVQKTEKDSKPIKYNTPILTPEQVIEGLLRLVDSLHESTDLTPERVKETVGVNLKSTKEGKSLRYSFANAFPSTEWIYGLDIIPIPLTNLPSLYFRFLPLNSKKNRYPLRTTICRIDGTAINRQMKQMGYEHVGTVQPGTGLVYQYKRGSIFIELVYVGESKDNPHHDCLDRMKII